MYRQYSVVHTEYGICGEGQWLRVIFSVNHIVPPEGDICESGTSVFYKYAFHEVSLQTCDNEFHIVQNTVLSVICDKSVTDIHNVNLSPVDFKKKVVRPVHLYLCTLVKISNILLFVCFSFSMS